MYTGPISLLQIHIVLDKFFGNLTIEEYRRLSKMNKKIRRDEPTSY
jgi:hypothetical protein